MTYTPQTGSIAHQIIAHLTNNPDQTMTKHDLAAKFGKPTNSFCTYLSKARYANVVKLATNADGELAYSLGTPQPKPTTPVTPAAAPAPYITGQPRTVWVKVAPRKQVAA